MRKIIDQSREHDPENDIKGDCMQAAVATLLGIELADVPDFTHGLLLADGDPVELMVFWRRFHYFFEQRGLLAHRVVHSVNPPPEALHLVDGMSPRGTMHMVVMRGRELFHDPHPSRAGIKFANSRYVITPIDITEWRRA